MDEATRQIAALLAPLTNYERTRPDAARFTLATMRALLDRLGARARPPGPCVQIGGSKGKGTTAAYLEAIARAAGLRTGVYASPHVSSILERVRIDGRADSAAALEAACRQVIARGAGLDPPASFFEVMTAAAMLRFAAERVDLAVLEVGLGGRLDATTACQVDASVLTGVELEHTELLGDTIEAIAGEKAFVFRPGKVGVHGCADPAARVVEARAAAIGCRLLALGRELRYRVVAADAQRRQVEITVAGAGPGSGAATIELVGAPPWEVRALALALAAFWQVLPGLPAPARLERPRLPGRFEVLPGTDGSATILDGAHTPDSAALVAGEVIARHGPGATRLLFGMARGKRWAEVLSALLPAVSEIAVTPVPGTASTDPGAIADWLAQQSRSVEVVADPADAIAWLRAGTGPRLVTGSFYLVGQVRDALLAESADP